METRNRVSNCEIATLRHSKTFVYRDVYHEHHTPRTLATVGSILICGTWDFSTVLVLEA